MKKETLDIEPDIDIALIIITLNTDYEPDEDISDDSEMDISFKTFFFK